MARVFEVFCGPMGRHMGLVVASFLIIAGCGSDKPPIRDDDPEAVVLQFTGLKAVTLP